MNTHKKSENKGTESSTGISTDFSSWMKKIKTFHDIVTGTIVPNIMLFLLFMISLIAFMISLIAFILPAFKPENSAGSMGNPYGGLKCGGFCEIDGHCLPGVGFFGCYIINQTTGGLEQYYDENIQEFKKVIYRSCSQKYYLKCNKLKRRLWYLKDGNEKSIKIVDAIDNRCSRPGNGLIECQFLTDLFL